MKTIKSFETKYVSILLDESDELYIMTIGVQGNTKEAYICNRSDNNSFEWNKYVEFAKNLNDLIESEIKVSKIEFLDRLKENYVNDL